MSSGTKTVYYTSLPNVVFLKFDSLIERLTGREYLTCIARLRGYVPSSISEVVQKIIDRLDLNEYADRTCGTYRLAKIMYSLITCTCFSFYVSGGNKRKLSTAVALVGDPSVVFLVRFSYFTWPILTNKT